MKFSEKTVVCRLVRSLRRRVSIKTNVYIQSGSGRIIGNECNFPRLIVGLMVGRMRLADDWSDIDRLSLCGQLNGRDRKNVGDFLLSKNPMACRYVIKCFVSVCYLSTTKHQLLVESVEMCVKNFNAYTDKYKLLIARQMVGLSVWGYKIFKKNLSVDS